MYSRSAAISSHLRSAAAAAVSTPFDVFRGSRPARSRCLARRIASTSGAIRPLGRKPVKPVLRHVQCFRARRELGCVLALALVSRVAPQGEPAHKARQQQSLADQRGHDHSERHEQNEIAMGKRRAGERGQRNRQHRRQRDDAAYADEREEEGPLPGRSWIAARKRGIEPAWQINRRIDPDEPGNDDDCDGQQDGEQRAAQGDHIHLIEQPSAAELTVLRCLARGLSRREIGAELYISLNTVKTHIRDLYRKLGAASREDAIARAEALGLLDLIGSPG